MSKSKLTRIAIGLGLLIGVGTISPAADVDRLRALLYRIDGEANLARMHPELTQHADAAARFANDFASRVGGDRALAADARALARATKDLSHEARQRARESAVRDAAIDVSERVRAIDDKLPPPPPAPLPDR